MDVGDATAYGVALLYSGFGIVYAATNPRRPVSPDYYLCSLKHRTVAGKGECASWEFGVVRGIHAPRPTLYARLVLAQGAHAVDVEIPLCTNRVPSPLSFPVTQSSPGTWRVACARYGDDLHCLAQPSPFVDGEDLPIGPLLLLGAPPSVDSDLQGIEAALLEGR